MNNKFWLKYLSNEGFDFESFEDLVDKTWHGTLKNEKYCYVVATDSKEGKILKIEKIDIDLYEKWSVAYNDLYDGAILPVTETTEHIFEGFINDNLTGISMCVPRVEVMQAALLALKDDGYTITAEGECFRTIELKENEKFFDNEYIKSVLLELEDEDFVDKVVKISKDDDQYLISLFDEEKQTNKILVKCNIV